MTVSSEELAITDSETLEEVIECLVENFSDSQGLCDQKTIDTSSPTPAVDFSLQ
ncbi:hypothetical protein LC653_39310 [Nostoc sp. CHAB 5784]|uniref:hypothetical protein n=1 Tax=Nostoc mirabile TaxID=2907820 RepID=UPI001E509424|nr:hypothetical protein [Nostoc mirabile]MCC5669699.1 hypothetical protein [Nostoc mirabile CHAB5784]